MAKKKRKSSRKTAQAAYMPAELPFAALRRNCTPSSLSFETTDELPRLEAFIGQPRAYKALELGSEVKGRGFNIFVTGLPASGRTTLSREYLERVASKMPTPDDWCYVNNFEDPHQPLALRLPAGRAGELRSNIKTLIQQSEQSIQRAFASDEYRDAQNEHADKLKIDRERELTHLQAYAAEYNFVIASTPIGHILVPAVEGQPLTPEEIDKLSPEQHQKLEKLEEMVRDEVEITLTRIRKMEQETQEKMQELDEQTALFVVSPLVKECKVNFTSLDQVAAHLQAVQDDVVVNVAQFHPDNHDDGTDPTGRPNRELWLSRYEVNVLVDNSKGEGAPVIVETQPSHHNLTGRIEHQVLMGASRTDFTMIRPGALHRANGGFLILPGRDVLINPYAWEGLKRALRDNSIRIVELGNQLGLVSTATLEPGRIPLDIKIVVIGTPLLYYLLRAHDEDFPKLFKVQAEFTTQMERNTETEHEYALFVKSVADDNDLPPFDHTAVARVVEYGSRLVADQNKLSTRFGKMADLVREAAFWAKKAGETRITSRAVAQAVEESVYRSNLIEERVQELIEQGTLIIDVQDTAVGQINALSVISLGDYAFGRPSRITATVSPGRGGVVDIERKADLGGPIHTKGVLILNGFLSGRYGRHKPLGLSARITFEQSYSGVEGDSASAAELLALLSALTEIPLRQDLAITGSINQHGAIQSIGGVNEKIEGFFAICQQKGLTGDQGVIMPAHNTRNLMLRTEVVDAVEAGSFHVWPVATLDEALALLTGMEPGELQLDGTYVEGTFNHAVLAQLDAFLEVMKGPLAGGR